MPCGRDDRRIAGTGDADRNHEAVLVEIVRPCDLVNPCPAQHRLDPRRQVEGVELVTERRRMEFTGCRRLILSA